MKACLVVLLGAADRPHAALRGETPLQRARVPHVEALRRSGRLGSLRTSVPGRAPGFEAALPRLLGYDASTVIPAGPLEALGLGRSLRADETAFLADFVTVLDGVMADPLGGRPREAEAALLRDAVNAALGGEGRLEAGSRPWRNLLYLAADGADRTTSEAPHALGGLPVAGHDPEGPAAARLAEVVRRATAVLGPHEVNAVRVDLHENPVSGLWCWGGGRVPVLEPASERIGARVVVVSGPGYARGLAEAAGCEHADAGPEEGGAAEAALRALDAGADLAVVVVTGPLEASLAGDPSRKVQEIERADGSVVGPLREGLASRGGEHRMAVCADTAVSSADRRALPDPVPFVLAGAGVPASRRETGFTEEAAKTSDLSVDEAADFAAYVPAFPLRARGRPRYRGGMSDEIPTRYDPHEVEARLYPQWEARGDWTADPGAVTSGKRKPFVIMIPPPNVTGALHMGHALNNTLQDVLSRWHRMLGDEVLWLPGIDHAGIATQAVVEKKLFEERKTRRIDMGREAFLEEVWAWKEKYGGTILGQLRRLGCSCDWSRSKFTMDPGLSAAVRRTFVSLFDEGLVYRGARIVNWDCALETAVSDDEIEYEDRKGKLWHIRYPREDGKGFVVVATTRPETMLGDTGVAVNPGDERYRGVAGTRVLLPLLDRPIPVVADASVEMGFGTGAVKVTPGHDPADYERGKRHGLPVLIVLDGKGRITKEGGPYAGLSREQARDRIVKDLEERGLLERIEDHPMRVAVSDRSKSVIEPLVSEQWFVDMKRLAAPAIAAVKDGTLSFRPERWTKVYLDWLENVQDWCISRQLWWGHRIPVWYDADGAPAAFLEDPAPGAVHPRTGKPLVRQDDDVLDTWASSWLWPMSTLGWPDREGADYRAFYPTSFLSTAREIIYLWVARMVMAGYHFDGRCPFGTVYIHATILDGKGRRMSKSAGNGIDPVDMIAKYGADAVRFTLVDLTTEGQDVRLAENRFEVGRNFMNKLWNAGRFIAGAGGARPLARPAEDAFSVEDRWILHRLARTVEEATAHLAAYRFHDHARTLYGFAWNELCDWYLEIVKPRLEGTPGPAVLWTLRECYGTLLRLLHPSAPFLTEEMAARLALRPEGCATLGKAPWPAPAETEGGAPAAEEIALLQSVVTAVRNLRAEYRVGEAEAVDVDIRCPAGVEAALRRHEAAVRRLGKIENLAVGPAVARRPKSAVAHLPGEVEVYLPLEGRIDLDAEKERLGKEIAKAEANLAGIDRKLGNADFVARAKPEVVEAERARRAEVEEMVRRLRGTLEALG